MTGICIVRSIGVGGERMHKCRQAHRHRRGACAQASSGAQASVGQDAHAVDLCATIAGQDCRRRHGCGAAVWARAGASVSSGCCWDGEVKLSWTLSRGGGAGHPGHRQGQTGTGHYRGGVQDCIAMSIGVRPGMGMAACDGDRGGEGRGSRGTGPISPALPGAQRHFEDHSLHHDRRSTGHRGAATPGVGGRSRCPFFSAL